MKALLSIWGDTRIQEELDGVVRIKLVYQKIAEKMNEAGHDRDWKQCRQKVKNLKIELEKAEGRGRKICWYYEELEKIIGSRAAVSPPQLLESTGISVGSENKDDDDSIIDNINSESDSQLLNEIQDKNDETINNQEDTSITQSPSSETIKENFMKHEERQR